ncbi:MAG TPA: ABC transporter substrate-binding protein [Candidatus Baltobacteraceae bacterium]|nr:ABC transporter substrate-binding protein [Candidatus Baltobacteraceae bacterium]
MIRAAIPLIAALALLSACAQRTATPSGPAHVLRIAYAGDPNSLVPLVAIDSDLTAMDTLFCQTLIGLDARNQPVPILLTRIPSRSNGDVSPDGKLVTYHLRRGVRFADGVEFTSADVAFTYQAVLDPRNHAVTVQPYRSVESLQTPDRYTVQIKLRRPWNAAVYELLAEGDFIFGILPKHAFTDTKVLGTAWENAPFGTGPFRVKEWARGDKIVFVPNPYYSPKPKLQQIVLQIYPNLNSNFVALRSGAVDIGNLTSENLAEASKIPGIRIVRIPDNGTNLLYLNTKIEPTSDIQVRRAIAYALDYAALANAWKREYDPATGFLPPPIVRWKGVVIPPYSYDLAAANRELDAAGWHLQNGTRTKNGVPMTGVIAASSENPTMVRIATVVQAQLAAAGMHFELKTEPVRVWFSPQGLLRSGKAALMIEAWVGGMDPEQSLNLQCSQAVVGDSNHSFYCSKAFESRVADQATTPSEAQRWRDFDEMQRLVHRDIPVIPLYYDRVFHGVSTRVTGYAINILWIPVNVENWDAR